MIFVCKGRSGIRKVVRDRGTLEDGVVCTGTLDGAEESNAGRGTSVDGGEAVACWMAWSKMRAN